MGFMLVADVWRANGFYGVEEAFSETGVGGTENVCDAACPSLT